MPSPQLPVSCGAGSFSGGSIFYQKSTDFHPAFMEGSRTATRVRFAVEDDVEADSRPSKRRRTESLQLAGKDESRINEGQSGHRLGVLPAGNLFLAGSSAKKNIRSKGLGRFDILPDAVLLVVLASFNASTLLALRTTSRAFFAYTSHEPLWKDVVVSRANGRLSHWEGSWRKTYIRSFGRCPPNLPSEWPTDAIRTPGVYSDELYQPSLCAHTSLTPYFLPHPTRPRSTIAKADALSLTAETFSELYAIPSKPALIYNAINDWPSLKQSFWTMDALETRFKDVSFRAEAFDLPFHLYRQYSDDCDEEDSPLYLFDSRFVEKTGGAMGKEYSPFPFFGKDVFELLGEERPNYRWLVSPKCNYTPRPISQKASNLFRSQDQPAQAPHFTRTPTGPLPGMPSSVVEKAGSCSLPTFARLESIQTKTSPRSHHPSQFQVSTARPMRQTLCR